MRGCKEEYSSVSVFLSYFIGLFFNPFSKVFATRTFAPSPSIDHTPKTRSVSKDRRTDSDMPFQKKVRRNLPPLHPFFGGHDAPCPQVPSKNRPTLEHILHSLLDWRRLQYTMAARTLGRIARLRPAVSHRCTVPAVGRISGVGNSHRDSSEDDGYVRALVSQTRGFHVTRRNDSSVLLAGAGIAVSAMIARYGLEEYKKYQVSFG